MRDPPVPYCEENLESSLILRMNTHWFSLLKTISESEPVLGFEEKSESNLILLTRVLILLIRLVLRNIFSASENCQFWVLKTLILQTPAAGCGVP